MKHLIERTSGFPPSPMLCAARFRDLSIVGRAANGFLLGMLICGAVASSQAEPVNKSPTSVAEVAGGGQKTAPPLTKVLRIVQDPTGRQLQSAFIWTDVTASGSNAGVAVGFRKSFSLEQKPSSAFLHLFADARYVLWVNGTYVERGPSRFQPNGPEYDSVEIAPFLQAGKNSIALLCIGNLSGGKVMRHEPGMTAMLQIGKQMLWSTDESWKWTDSTRFRSVSASWANLGESMVDARVEDGDWTLPGYDDSHWKTPARISGTSWGPLTARRIPLLRETDVPVSFTKGETLPVTLKAGEKLEFSTGRMVQAYPLITLEAEAGTVLRIEPHGVTYVAKAGPQSYFTIDTRGFISGTIAVSKGQARITGFKLVERLYPFDCAGTFTCSDPFLDRLWALCARSCQVLSEDSYVDCADRERVEWMDDTPPGYDITRTALAVTGIDGSTHYGDPRLLGALIRRTALTLQPEGWVKAHTCSDRYDIHAKMEDRACDWVEGVRLYQEATGDKEAVREVWPALVAQMDYFLNRRTERGLVRARDWVVWANPVGYFTGEGTTLNVFVCRALEDTAKLGTLIGEETDSRRFSKAADELKRAINTVLWDEAAGTYAAGYFTDADIAESNRKLSLPRKNNIAAPTLYSSVFALDRGVVPPERRERVLQAMLKQKPSEKRHVMIYYYLAKQLYGLDAPVHDQQVLDIFRENWLMMVDAPYQCSWEVFGGGSSKAHIYGMYPGYFLSSYVLGVRRDAPVSSRELRIEPHLGDLSRAEGTVITEYGPVPVAWKKTGMELDLTITVPAELKTTLSLPYRAGHERIRLDGKDVMGVRKGNRLEIPLGAGAHRATVSNDPAPFTPAADLAGDWSFTADPKLPNVLILGDSISIGYTRRVREKLIGKANVYRPMVSKTGKASAYRSMNGNGPDNCGDTTVGLANIDGWLGQQKWDVIHFNWGLWDLCYRNPDSKEQGNRDKVGGKLSTTPIDYEKNLEQLVTRLEATGAKLIWANTTLVPEGEVGRFVGDDGKYNAIAARVMKKHGIATDDLFTLTKGFSGKLSTKAGDVHFTEQGYEKLAGQVAATIEESLTKKTGP